MEMKMVMRRPNHSNENTGNELAVVRASAWAWFQHGSGSQVTSIREFDLATSRSGKAVRASRFKLEAMRLATAEEDDKEEEGSSDDYSLSSFITLSPTQTDNSLLDAYEIKQISRQFDSLMAESSSNGPYSYRRSSQASHVHRHYGEKTPPPPPLPLPTSRNEEEKMNTKKKKKPKGSSSSWLKYGVICSSTRGDVVEPRSFKGSGLKSRVPVSINKKHPH